VSPMSPLAAKGKKRAGGVEDSSWPPGQAKLAVSQLESSNVIVFRVITTHGGAFRFVVYGTRGCCGFVCAHLCDLGQR
jgi:hypothetical protein